MSGTLPVSGAANSEWKSTACILCECNCGIELQLGGKDGRHLVKVRGDDAHPASKGYACEKAHRIDFYQNGPHRLTKPRRLYALNSPDSQRYVPQPNTQANNLRSHPRPHPFPLFGRDS
jgi:hypothetical protein